MLKISVSQPMGYKIFTATHGVHKLIRQLFLQ